MSRIPMITLALRTHAKAWQQRAFTLAFLATVFADQALAQGVQPVGGGTGNASAVQARVTNVASTVQLILYTIGGVVLGAAFLWACYGVALGGKKWSDVGNVAGAAVAAGLVSVVIGWLFF